MDIPENDPITGLPTLSLVTRCFEQLARSQNQFGMLLLDIDGFILFNDLYGHQEGDKKLKQIANLICQEVPKDASIFRCGGDEFAIFLSGLGMAEVVLVAMKIRDTINQQFASLPTLQRSYWFPDRSNLSIHSHLTVSCGVTFYPAHGASFTDLYESAHKAMYRGGKRLHRGGVFAVAELER